MIIAATGDIHSPQYYEEFVKAVDQINVKPDLFLLLGDMVNRGRVEEYEKVCNVLFGKIHCPIVACFGNNEYQDVRDAIKKRYTEIKFLDDEGIILKIGMVSVGIVGTTGSLDEPTIWQKRNVPNIDRVYRERVSLVDRYLQRLMTDFKILMIHYAPTYKTLEGENSRFHPNLGSRMYEKALIDRKPDLVLHGHGHRGLKHAWVDTVPVFNVAFPINREIVIIDTENDLKPGITKFV